MGGDIRCGGSKREESGYLDGNSERMLLECSILERRDEYIYTSRMRMEKTVAVSDVIGLLTIFMRDLTVFLYNWIFSTIGARV